MPALLAAGHAVSALARTPDKAATLSNRGAQPVSVSLFDCEGLTAAFAGHDAVVNLASALPPTHRMILPSAWTDNHRVRGEGSDNVADAASAVVAALESPSGIYSVVDDQPVTARDNSKAVAAAVGTNMWLRAPGRAASLLGQRTTSVTRSLRVSNARFRAATAWEPRYSSVGEGYRAMAEDTKQQRRRSTA